MEIYVMCEISGYHTVSETSIVVTSTVIT